MMHYFSCTEILNRIRDNLANYDESQTIGDLFDDLFNSNYYIIGSYKAAQALDGDWQNDWEDLLKQYVVDLPGVFGALQLVRHYNEDTIGIEDVDMDEFLNPAKLANKVEFILAAYLMDKMLISRKLDYESHLSNKVKHLLSK